MKATLEKISKGSEVSSKQRVDVTSRVSCGSSCKGVVKSIDTQAQTAEVGYEIPNTPTVCAECGSGAELSVSGNTGEVECLATGCGHGHGFKTVHVVVPLSQLELYAAYRSRKRKTT